MLSTQSLTTRRPVRPQSALISPPAARQTPISLATPPALDQLSRWTIPTRVVEPRSEPAPARPSQQSAWIRRDQLRTAVVLIGKDLKSILGSDPIDAAILRLLESLEADAGKGPAPSTETWAKLAVQLRDLVQMVKRQPVPACQGMSRVEFVKKNLEFLEKTCRYSWARDARAHLLDLFADSIEKQSSNPALQRITTWTGSVQAATPVPILKVGGEISYQNSHAVNDDGHFVVARTVSGAVTLSLSLLLAKLKTSLGTAIGRAEYCRTATDHSLYFFNDWFASVKNRPELATFVALETAAGESSWFPTSITEFTTIQNDFLLHREHGIQLLSLLLSTETAGSEDPKNTPVPIDWRINLQTEAEPRARSVRQKIYATTGKAAVTTGIAVNASLSGEQTRKTTHSNRVKTMCELLRDETISEQNRTDLRSQIGTRAYRLNQQLYRSWNLSDRPEPPEVRLCMGRLQQDLALLTRLHASQQRGVAKTNQSIARICQQYGANDSFQCMANMALVTADLYRQTFDRAHGPQRDALLTELVGIERSLFHSPVPGARRYLEKHALAKQRFEQSRTEKTIQIKVAGTLLNGGVGGTAKITKATISHQDPFASGEQITVEFGIGVYPEVNRELLKAISGTLQPMASSIANYFQLGTVARQGLYTLRFFKPTNLPNRPYALQFRRISQQDSTQLGLSTPIPLPVPVQLELGANYSDLSTKMLTESLGDNSVLYYFRHFFHARTTNKIDAQGSVRQKNYWTHLEQANTEDLENLFRAYARGADDLNQELDAIDQLLELSPLVQERVRLARNDWLVRAKNFASLRTLDNYQTTLAAFKLLMGEYYGPWLRKRETSRNVRPWQIAPR